MNARGQRQRVFAASLVLSVGALAACGGGDSTADPGQTSEAESESIRLTLGAGHPTGAMTYTTYAHEFLVPEIERRVAEETPHTIEIDEQYGGSVTPADQVLEGTRDGLVDIGLVPYQFEASTLPVLNFASYAPFSSPDPQVILEAGRTAMEQTPEAAALLEEEFNQTPLAFIAVGDYGLGTKSPVNGPDDLAGMKITGAGTNLTWIEAVGGVPLQSVANEWYNGLQTGLYDGAVFYLDGYAGFKLYEVAPHFTRTGFGSIFAGGVHVNNDSWEELPDDVRGIIEEVAMEYETTFHEALDRDEAKGVEAVAAAGAEITEMSEEQRVSWAAQLPNLPQQFVEANADNQVPADKIMRLYLQSQADQGYEFPRDWGL